MMLTMALLAFYAHHYNYVNIEKDEHDSEYVNGNSVNVSLSTIFEESSSERTEISQQP